MTFIKKICLGGLFSVLLTNSINLAWWQFKYNYSPGLIIFNIVASCILLSFLLNTKEKHGNR